jgi:hypothetical protein
MIYIYWVRIKDMNYLNRELLVHELIGHEL